MSGASYTQATNMQASLRRIEDKLGLNGMTETDVKNNILHSLGTLCALGMVIDSRISALDPCTVHTIAKTVRGAIKEMEVAYHKQISS